MCLRKFKTALCLALLGGAVLNSFTATLPPSFTSTATETNSAVRFDFQATPGFGYLIEASTNFTDWIYYSSLLAANKREAFSFPSSGFGPNYFFRLQEFGPPPNDQFANSLELKGMASSVTASNLGATTEPGEPSHGFFNANGKSVWWKWTAPGTGYAYLSAVGTSFDTLLAVYTGNSVTNLVPIARKRSWTKLLAFDAVADQTYHIVVDGNPDGFQPIRLHLTLTNAPPPTAPSSIDNVSIVVNDTLHASAGERLVTLSGTNNWREYAYGLTNIAWQGTQYGYKKENSSARLTLLSFDPGSAYYTNVLEYLFDFVTDRTGSYQRFLDGELHGDGTFSDFRSVTGGLAPPALAGAVLQTTNVTTSLGIAGQTHSFTFDAAGSYHDSDGTDQAWGAYSYSNDGNSGAVKMQVQSPLLFRGDDYQLRLKFVSAISGTFDGTYVRNDGAVISITGNFLLDYGK